MFRDLIDLVDEIGRLESSINAGYTDRGYTGELNSMKAQFNERAGGLMSISKPTEFIREDMQNDLYNYLYG